MASGASKKAPSKAPKEDVVLVYGQSEDGGYGVLRQRGSEVEAGTMIIHVDDFGEGMDRAIIDTRLTRLFSSSNGARRRSA